MQLLIKHGYLPTIMPEASKVFGVIMLGTTVASALYGVTDYTLATYGGMRVYWLLMGLCVASIHLDE